MHKGEEELSGEAYPPVVDLSHPWAGSVPEKQTFSEVWVRYFIYKEFADDDDDDHALRVSCEVFCI